MRNIKFNVVNGVQLAVFAPAFVAAVFDTPAMAGVIQVFLAGEI